MNTNNLTIVQMREIVDGAPSNAESYQGGYYFRESPQFMFHNGFHDQWNLTDNDGLYFRAAGFHPIQIDDLRTAIAEHDTTQLCIGCGSPDLHKGGEIKEPKMCLDCFAEMVGFTRTSNGFVESDEVTDIRNHVSPSTRVVDHE